MSYHVGIDLGTTYTSAAVSRDGLVETASLGTRAPVVPSVVLLRDDGEFLVGEAAERRAASEPHRAAREFKRRVGDPTPIILAGTPSSADALTARLLRWTIDKVAESEGARAAGVAVCHPANWGEYKKDLLRQSIRQADVDDAVMVSEPEAAAIHYASQERVPAGSLVAVYDLGGGTFDVAVLRRDDAGWEILGAPEGIERLGGIDFDEAVFRHVTGSLGGAVEELDPDDAAALAAVTRLRQECVAAKEALASDTDASIPIMLPNVQTEVRLTRGEFEDLIRPPLGESVAALHRALRSADVDAADVSAVLLVGGSSRIPLVAQLVGAELGRPVAVDAHPKHGVALGAAIVAAGADGSATADDTDAAMPAEVVTPGAPRGSPPPPPGGGEERPREAGDRLPRRRRAALVAAIAALALVALAGGAFALTRGDSSPTTVVVPDVVGLTEEAAVQRLQDEGLAPDVQPIESDDVDEGLVVDTEPSAGEEVEPGEPVVITVSTGPGAPEGGPGSSTRPGGGGTGGEPGHGEEPENGEEPDGGEHNGGVEEPSLTPPPTLGPAEISPSG